jgi:hypothetical protein
MAKQSVFYWIVLWSIRRIMSYSQWNTQFICKILNVIFEYVVPARIAASTIWKDKYTFCIWILRTTKIKPPIFYAITAKLTGIFTRSDIYVPFILFYIIYSMRNYNSVSKWRKVMVINFYCFFTISFPIPIEVAD